MSGKYYPEEFKIEAVNRLLSVAILFPASQHVSILLLTVFTPG
ncbi:Uncharacterised protein [Salmonella enterica subsp. enterica]|nr:Uncharacterised protein [Salmonella enterica subsp. enterica] [Salmonella enterica subsp. enterica serovar Sundsvall]SUH67052.1 Uncharacterised protein [Salmonella enterica subsp. enterica serovar Madelia]